MKIEIDESLAQKFLECDTQIVDYLVSDARDIEFEDEEYAEEVRSWAEAIIHVSEAIAKAKGEAV